MEPTLSKEEIKAAMKQMSYWQVVKFAYIQVAGLLVTTILFLPGLFFTAAFITFWLKHLWQFVLLIWEF